MEAEDKRLCGDVRSERMNKAKGKGKRRNSGQEGHEGNRDTSTATGSEDRKTA